jgi:hypothetical protein
MFKDDLLEAIAGKNRGLLASETDKVAILSAITQLEDRNPTPKPLELEAFIYYQYGTLGNRSRSPIKVRPNLSMFAGSRKQSI